MIKRILFFLLIYFSSIGFVSSQTSILIYEEHFENGAPGVTLNTTGEGNNYGNNQWIINDKYDGDPLYPNTPDESQTTGGTINYAPKSKYLHIYDQKAGTNNNIFNCNYDPTDSSDRIVQLTYGSNGFCTLGIMNVKIAFFYIGLGSGNAHAELYYSADGGPWTQTGTIYNNQPIWKYEIIQNPAFDNKVNLRFGFRWVNERDTSNVTKVSSIGIDDIFIKGDFDNFVTNFNIIIDSLKPSPVCQNFSVNIYYHLTATLCGDGFGVVQLSDSTGSFSNPTVLAIFTINNQVKNGILSPTIPSTTPPGKCYKIRIEYYYTDYALDFLTLSTVCFEVKHCPNTVTTLKAVVITKEDSLCVGSVIDIPFWSTGVFLKNNNYVAELSDSTGHFSSNLNILGTSPDPNTYDPALTPAPGNVSGLVNDRNQPIPNGCNYYIRVNSTSPLTLGSVYGPFCIKHCDIETNHKIDIQACLHSCRISSEGFNTSVNIKIHDHDTTAIYNSDSNQFKVELRDPIYFSLVSLGRIGKIYASNDTTLKVHIPCSDSLGNIGLMPGLYYMRIVATKSNHPYNVNGTLIRLIIGAPSDFLFIYQDPPDSMLCLGDGVVFYPEPNNSYPPMNSTYQWFLNGKLFSTNPVLGVLFTNTGTFNITVQETNNGCKGPVTPNSTKLYVLSTPNANISGPNQVCLGDIYHYSVPFVKNVYYEWSTTGGKIDTSNNTLNISFDTEGVYKITLLALNHCGQAIGSKSIIVTAHPDANFSFISPVCTGNNSVIKATGNSPPPLTYTWNFGGGVATPGGNNPGPFNVYWKTAGSHKVILTVSKNGCKTTQSYFVNVLQKPEALFSFKNQCLGDTIAFKDSSLYKPNTREWDFGDGSVISSQINPAHVYTDSGSYAARLVVSLKNGCKDTLIKNVDIYPVPTVAFDAKSPVCNGQNAMISFTGKAPAGAEYNWNFYDGAVVSGSGRGPYEISWSEAGYHKIELAVSKDGCGSNNKDSVNVEVCELDIPNIFTPNNDGDNDVFKIKGLENFPDSKLMIFDRWGNKIYENDNYQNDWNGENHTDGAYFYILTLKNGNSYKGNVTIIK